MGLPLCLNSPTYSLFRVCRRPISLQEVPTTAIPVCTNDRFWRTNSGIRSASSAWRRTSSVFRNIFGDSHVLPTTRISRRESAEPPGVSREGNGSIPSLPPADSSAGLRATSYRRFTRATVADRITGNISTPPGTLPLPRAEIPRQKPGEGSPQVNNQRWKLVHHPKRDAPFWLLLFSGIIILILWQVFCGI